LAPITATEAAFICPSFSAQKSSQKDQKEPNLLLVNRFIRYNKRVKLFIGLAFILGEFLGLSRERAREREREREMASWNSIPLEITYEVLGWTAFLSWSISFYPQVILNFQRKR
jgi:hypothetical protein